MSCLQKNGSAAVVLAICGFLLFVRESSAYLHDSTVWFDSTQVANVGFSVELDSAYAQKRDAEIGPGNATNPAKIIALGLIWVYRFFFSSQDGSTCQFRPSCSHFGAESVREYHVLGILMTADRLIRCNPFSIGTYPLTPDSSYHYDPVEMHRCRVGHSSPDSE